MQRNMHCFSQFIVSTDLDQQSTYSTTSPLTLSSLSSPSPPLSVSPNYNISNLNWSVANNFTMFTNQLSFTINTATHNIFTELKINNKNLSKTSIFIGGEIISFINQFCVESFHTDQKDDLKLLFSYIKESNGMQINDKQINIHHTIKGKIIISNIDLHFIDGKIMYLIGMLNDLKYVERTPWKIITIMSDDTIYKYYDIPKDKLPKSSRNKQYFMDALQISPEYVSENIIWALNFKKLCSKQSKKNDKSYNYMKTVNISEYDLKCYCSESWNNGMFLPVVFIKGENQCIEWKKFVRIFDDENGNQQWVGISLRYYKSNKQWRITCMDYDGGRVFYQFRLVGDNHNYYNYSYNDLNKLVNTKLNIL